MKKEWLNEPDQLEGEYQGLRWLILRNEIQGSLCGYVGVTNKHSMWGKDGDDLEVHGGITFAEEGDGQRRSKHLWWFGFDCGHAGDLIPRFVEDFYSPKDHEYRNIEYVKKECFKLIDQLQEIDVESKRKVLRG